MVPLIHPYFVVEGGEIHHRARYARYPLMALLLDAGEQDGAHYLVASLLASLRIHWP